jgi:serine/threonine protein kinase
MVSMHPAPSTVAFFLSRPCLDVMGSILISTGLNGAACSDAFPMLVLRHEQVDARTEQLKIDFGLAQNPDQRNVTDASPISTAVLTSWYRAPEVILEAPYGECVTDCWSVGCTLYEIWQLVPPLPSHKLRALFRSDGDAWKVLLDTIYGTGILETPPPSLIELLKKRLGNSATSKTHYLRELSHHGPARKDVPRADKIASFPECIRKLMRGFLEFLPDKRLKTSDALSCLNEDAQMGDVEVKKAMEEFESEVSSIKTRDGFLDRLRKECEHLRLSGGEGGGGAAVGGDTDQTRVRAPESQPLSIQLPSIVDLSGLDSQSAQESEGGGAGAGSPRDEARRGVPVIKLR